MTTPSPLSPDEEGQEPQLLSTQEFAESLNQQLFSTGTSFSERAFGIGCTALTLPILILLGISYLFGNRSWAGICIALVIEILLALTLVTLFAQRSRSGATQRTYREEIWPEIQRYLSENELSPEAFTQVIENNLSKDAILRQVIQEIGLPPQPPKE